MQVPAEASRLPTAEAIEEAARELDVFAAHGSILKIALDTFLLW
jgi:hypothetical protein